MGLLRALLRLPRAALVLLWRIAVMLVMGLVVVVTSLLKWASVAIDVLRALGRLVLGQWLYLVPGMSSGPAGVVLGVALFIVHYLAFWTAVWWIQWSALAHVWAGSSTWIVGSRSGLQTTLQVLPATVVAILVFVLGAVFVVAQLAVAAWGQRATIMLGFDKQIQVSIVRPLLLAVATLLLAGQVPDSGDPTAAATAAVATCVLATVVMIVLSASLLVTMLQRYTMPRAFPQFVVEGIRDELEDGSTDLVVLRGPLLGEALKLSLRRSDSVATVAVLEAFVNFVEQYLGALTHQPGVRSHALDTGEGRPNWLAEDITHSLVAAGEEGLRELAAASDVNGVAQTLANCASQFLEAGEFEDAAVCIDGLIGLSTTAHQITPGGATNAYSEPVGVLARLEAVAERIRDEAAVAPPAEAADARTAREVRRASAEAAAVHALAGWALGVGYSQFHHEMAHPLYLTSLQDMGGSPPWDEAEGLVQTPDWARTWANKQYTGSQPVIRVLRQAQSGLPVTEGSSPTVSSTH